MEVELKEMLNDLESLKQSLPDPSHRASIDKVFFQIHSYSYVCMYMRVMNVNFCGLSLNSGFYACVYVCDRW